MTVISNKFAHYRQDREEVSEGACAEKADLRQSLVCFAPILLYSSRRVTVAFAYGTEVVADPLVPQFPVIRFVLRLSDGHIQSQL
jgi:hypothetical protein